VTSDGIIFSAQVCACLGSMPAHMIRPDACACMPCQPNKQVCLTQCLTSLAKGVQHCT
jgi:hypothetical protein